MALPRQAVFRWMRYREGSRGIFGIVGENASQSSRTLSAMLSEAGIANAWLSLRRRPQSFLIYGERLLQQVPYLVVDAEPPELRALWLNLYACGRTEAPFVWDGQAAPVPTAIEGPLQIPAHLSPHMREWVPFFLTSVLP